MANIFSQRSIRIMYIMDETNKTAKKTIVTPMEVAELPIKVTTEHTRIYNHTLNCILEHNIATNNRISNNEMSDMKLMNRLSSAKRQDIALDYDNESKQILLAVVVVAVQLTINALILSTLLTTYNYIRMRLAILTSVVVTGYFMMLFIEFNSKIEDEWKQLEWFFSFRDLRQ